MLTINGPCMVRGDQVLVAYDNVGHVSAETAPVMRSRAAVVAKIKQ